MARPFRFFAPVLVLALALSGVGASAQELDPESFLGAVPEAVYRDLGAPAEVAAVPLDASRWQVAHFYPQFLTLSWHTNRVWQVRLDRRYAQEFAGLRMGQSVADAVNVLGPPGRSSEPGAAPEWVAWQLPYQQFSRVLRLVFDQNRLVEATYSRGDL